MHLSLRSLLLAILVLPACAVQQDDDGTRGGESVRRCAAGATVAGVDVSFYQGSVDWTRVRNAGYRFAFLRVSDGLSYPDDRFAANWTAAKSAGVLRGAYQYFRPGQDAVAQANLLLSKIGTLDDGDLPPVIDVETANGASDATIVAGVQAWLDRVEAVTGRTPIVYAAAGFWETIDGRARFARYPLWVANYGATCPAVPDTWSEWRFWQTTESGSVAGIAGGVDVNVWNGTLDQLLAFARATPAATFAIDWTRSGGGNATFTSAPPSSVTRVSYAVDDFVIGSSSDRASGFAVSSGFTVAKTGRTVRVDGLDAGGKVVATSWGSIDTTDGAAIYLQEKASRQYEIGLENVPSDVAAIEVRVDGYLLRDGVSGSTRSTRRAVLSSFTTLGERELVIDTYNADGSHRGTLRRTVTLR
jgi:lysozyme